MAFAFKRAARHLLLPARRGGAQPDPAATSRNAPARHLSNFPEQYARGALSSFVEWQHQNLKRLAFRALWEKYFESVDVFLLPTTFTTAIHARSDAARAATAVDTGRRHVSLLESPDLHHAGNVDWLSRDHCASGSEQERLTGGAPDCRAVSGGCDADRLRAPARAGDWGIPGTTGIYVVSPGSRQLDDTQPGPIGVRWRP